MWEGPSLESYIALASTHMSTCTTHYAQSTCACVHTSRPYTRQQEHLQVYYGGLNNGLVNYVWTDQCAGQRERQGLDGYDMVWSNVDIVPFPLSSALPSLCMSCYLQAQAASQMLVLSYLKPSFVAAVDHLPLWKKRLLIPCTYTRNSKSLCQRAQWIENGTEGALRAVAMQ